MTTIAFQCVVIMGFTYFDATCILCSYSAANRASARVAEKVGFTVEGRMRQFGLIPSPEMVADGVSDESDHVMTALFPDDRPRLPWFDAISASLTVLDTAGWVVWPTEP